MTAILFPVQGTKRKNNHKWQNLAAPREGREEKPRDGIFSDSNQACYHSTTRPYLT
ncbi:predicted protein [Botrytis cinerea T4]|uniref:Uncharacterized protein n=1 Tax=Botryotinia fuckeliana (strain T4) TaxID=999810 RepID=G2Y7E8_BOTF4|nr:predicted protein [Botrytis cinerea T4]